MSIFVFDTLQFKNAQQCLDQILTNKYILWIYQDLSYNVLNDRLGYQAHKKI